MVQDQAPAAGSTTVYIGGDDGLGRLLLRADHGNVLADNTDGQIILDDAVRAADVEA